jgi:hypothetical protein
MKKEIFLLVMSLSLIVLSCSKSDTPNLTPTTAFTADEASVNSKIDIANDDVANVVEEQLQLTLDNSTTSRMTEKAVATCPTVTRVPAFGTAVPAGTTVTKTIDFGLGCTRPNGNLLKGIVKISFVYNPTTTSTVVTCTFVDFYHNLRKIEGTKTFTRTMSVAPAGTLSHPIVTMVMDLKVTLLDGRVFSRVGNRTREITEGFTTPTDFTDDVYKVTGNWTTTFPNTTVQTSTITSPLIVKLACIPTNSPISQGVITFTRDNKTATLDYGDGKCDNLAVFTISGITINIVLEK